MNQARKIYGLQLYKRKLMEINPLNGNISLKTLDTPRQGLFSISTITSYAPYLAMGLIAAYLLAKKRA